MDDEASQLEALEHILSDANAEPIKLSYGFLRSITDNFSNEIGRGGFGAVYQGFLGNGDVAVKKLLNTHALRENQFLDEITCLKMAKHKNIVRFLGYCSETKGELSEFNGKHVMGEAEQKLLCFEYLPNGNIKHYLRQGRSDGDDWPLRYRMIRGICEGLQFLHGEHINHLDLKPENVMLDVHMAPKITDFGLSRCLDQGQSKVITKNIAGTLRYIAPETKDRNEISFKSDVYALGIIMIELLTGIDMIHLDNWVESVDDMDCPGMRKCTEIARKCTDRDRHNRPTMVEVIRDLDELESSMIPAGPSIDQVTPTAFPGTELAGLCPLELSFLLVPNQEEMRCHISLTNKTKHTQFLCLINWKFHKLRPMNTRAITFSRKPEEELSSGTDKYEMQVLTGRCDEEYMVQQICSLPLDKNAPYEDYFEKAHELLGFELHREVLTARVVAPNPDLLKRVYWTNKGPWDRHRIGAMDVHPTEPWVLVVESTGRKVYILNWQTKATPEFKTRNYYPQGKTVVKFVARKHWAVIGRTDGSIQVLECPKMNRINDFDAHSGGVTSLEVHPTRSFLLSACSLSVKLWDWNSGWSCIGMFKVTAQHVRHVMFYPKHATAFVSFHEDGKCKMWKIGHPNPVTEFQQLYDTTVKPFSYTGGRHFIASIMDQHAIIWNLQKEHVHRIDTTEDITVAACHPTRPILVTAAPNGFVRVWDSVTYRLMKSYDSGITDPVYIGFMGPTRLGMGSELAISILDIELE